MFRKSHLTEIDKNSHVFACFELLANLMNTLHIPPYITLSFVFVINISVIISSRSYLHVITDLNWQFVCVYARACTRAHELEAYKHLFWKTN